MLRSVVVLLLSCLMLAVQVHALVFTRRPCLTKRMNVLFTRRSSLDKGTRRLQLVDKAEAQDVSSFFFPEPTPSDMETLKNIYVDMAAAIEGENVEQALRLVSSNVGFVFRCNVPK